MTPEQAKRLLPIVQAIADGKEVQYKAGEDWLIHSKHSTLSLRLEYRIKPEPRVIYLNEYTRGSDKTRTSFGGPHENMASAFAQHVARGFVKTCKFIEVIE